MIEPNAHYELHGSRGREPNQDEQDWAPSRAGDPDTAAVEVDRLRHLPPVRLKEALEGIPMDRLRCVDLEQAFEFRLSKYIETPFRCVLSGQHGTCGLQKRRYGARQERLGRAPVRMRLRRYSETVWTKGRHGANNKAVGQ
jgi:hypothetical protein